MNSNQYTFEVTPKTINLQIAKGFDRLKQIREQLVENDKWLKRQYNKHFPELRKIVPDIEAYAKVVVAVGNRKNAVNVDMSEFLFEKVETQVKELAKVSTGSQIFYKDAKDDIIDQFAIEIFDLCEEQRKLLPRVQEQITSSEPKLVELVGKSVAAELISKAVP